ncbi:MAG: hypothetical protein Fur0010_24820 [Bdellovibrio sp.]
MTDDSYVNFNLSIFFAFFEIKYHNKKALKNRCKNDVFDALPNPYFLHFNNANLLF